MSIAVAVKKGKEVVLAADSQTNFGTSRVPSENHQAVKIRSVGSSLLATTGWGLYDNILDDYLSKRSAPRLTTKKSIFSFFLKLWKVLHDNYPFVRDQNDKENDSPFGDIDASFLIVNTSGIFFVAEDLSVSEFNQYYAIGAGSDFSLGALYGLYNSAISAEALALKAVQTAVEFNPFCGGAIQVEKKRLKK
ncbi:MAG: hypothetical protein GY868_17910 [Deltaproteobacteria bacterium]|nr:hypothetical protein [Deltaproteobacteria bacterium]